MNTTSNVSKTKQLKPETLEYGKERVENSPFQKFLRDNNIPDRLTTKDLDEQYNRCMVGQ